MKPCIACYWVAKKWGRLVIGKYASENHRSKSYFTRYKSESNEKNKQNKINYSSPSSFVVSANVNCAVPPAAKVNQVISFYIQNKQSRANSECNLDAFIITIAVFVVDTSPITVIISQSA